MFLKNYGHVWESFLRAVFVFENSFLFYIYIYIYIYIYVFENKKKHRNMFGCQLFPKQVFENCFGNKVFLRTILII